MELTARARIAQEIDLPAPTALWVLGAHLFVLLSAVPLVLVMPRAAASFTSPALVYAGVAVYTAGIAFECAQNTLDRWYLTSTQETFCDCLFNSFMIAGFSLMAMGASPEPWLWALSIVVALAHPSFYIAGSWVRFPLLTVALLLVDYAMYEALSANVAFVHTLLTFAGLYFLALLMRTHAQVFHGCAAACFGLSLYAFPWGIEHYSKGEGITWMALGIFSLCVAALFGMLWPWLNSVQATPHRHAARQHAAEVPLPA